MSIEDDMQQVLDATSGTSDEVAAQNVVNALRLALDMDKKQREYFTGRGREQLIAARVAEVEFRKVTS